MSSQEEHQRAIQLFQEGKFQEAARLLDKVLGEEETAERWNDWATAQLACQRVEEAELGYRYALALEPLDAQIAANLGALLANMERPAEAIPFLEQGAEGLDKPEQDIVRRLLAECHRRNVTLERGDNILLPARKEGPARERHPAEFFLKNGTPPERGQRQGAVPSAERESASILVVHEVLPLTDRSGSDIRLMQVLRALREQGHGVTYVARNAINQQPYAAALEEMGIRVYANDAERLRYAGIDMAPQWTLEQVLREERFDLAILFHWFWSGISVAEHYLEEIRRLSPQTLTAVLTDDFHGLRERRSAELSGFLSDWERAHDYEQRELEIYRRADLVLTISEEDSHKLLALVPDLEIGLLSMVAEPAPSGPGFSAREGLLFVGNFDNPSNHDAVRWLLERVWPQVRRKLPDIPLDVVGNNAPPELASLGPNVACLGHVPELNPLFLRYRLFVSPIRFGTGIKTKNVAALSHGLPLVTTKVGAEGMNLRQGEHALIADTPEEFAEAIVRAYTDAELWQTLARQGRDHVRREFSAERLNAQLRNLIDRARNFRHSQSQDAHTWSFLRVEEVCPEVLVHQPCTERGMLRVLGYVRLAEQLLAEGQPAAAREQLRHIFSFVRGPVPRNGLFVRVLEALERCYAELGEQERAEHCRLEAQRCRGAAPIGKQVRPGRATKSRKLPVRSQGKLPEISVVIPTFNRRDALSSCLLALGAQSLPSGQFEVVIVDDGSTDGTQDLCRKLSAPFPLQYVRQANAGPGLARKTGVEYSCGRYIVFFNDDTIAGPELLAEHLRVHHAHPQERWAVLGDFRYPGDPRQRALTYFLNTHPFLYLQPNMQSGEDYGYAHFVTCNLSVRRDAVLSAGSFDPQFRVAEDTDLGVRLEQRGYRVHYHAPARAWHDHLSITMGDLILRAQAYGHADLLLFRKHPQLLGDGSGPFGRLDEASALRIRDFLDRRPGEVEAALRSLQHFDTVDFLPYFAIGPRENSAADEVVALFAQAVPVVYWYYLYESFLEAWMDEQGHPEKKRAAELSSSCEANR